MTIDQENLDRLVAEWQERMGLNAWNVTARMLEVPTESEDRACVIFNHQQMAAEIHLPLEFADKRELYNLVCHELAHLYFWFLESGQPDLVKELVEEVVCQLGDTLQEYVSLVESTLRSGPHVLLTTESSDHA